MESTNNTAQINRKSFNMEMQKLTSEKPSIHPEICEKCGSKLRTIDIDVCGVIKKFNMACKCQSDIWKKEAEQEAYRQKQLRFQSLFRQSRLKEKFSQCTFENFNTSGNKDLETAYKKLKEYAENFSSYKKQSVLMASIPGTGKTHLSVAVMNVLLRRGITAVMVVVPDLLAQIRATYNRGSSETEERIMSGLMECDLLVLDDIGAERHIGQEDWATQQLYMIINNRYNSEKATIFTTNCNLKELGERLGTRILSRIIEMTEGYCLTINSKDYRMKNLYKE